MSRCLLLLLLFLLRLSNGNVISYDSKEFLLCFFGRYDLSEGEVSHFLSGMLLQIVVGVIPRDGEFSCVVSFYVRNENSKNERPNLWATSTGCYLVDKGEGKQRYIRCSCNNDSTGPCNSPVWFRDQLIKLIANDPKDALLLKKAILVTRKKNMEKSFELIDLIAFSSLITLQHLLGSIWIPSFVSF